MLKLRLQRRGKKNYATYRVVIAEQHAPVKGKFIADLGFYNPHSNDFVVDTEAMNKWLAQGAQPSDTVHNLLVTKGLLKAEKVTIWRPAKEQPAAAPTAEQKTETPEAETATTATPESTSSPEPKA